METEGTTKRRRTGTPMTGFTSEGLTGVNLLVTGSFRRGPTTVTGSETVHERLEQVHSVFI